MLWPGGWRTRVPPSRSDVDRTMSRLRHPSFTPDVAEEMTRRLSRRQLRRLWAETTMMLDTPLRADVRLHVVLLREQILHELERHDPAFGRIWSSTRR